MNFYCKLIFIKLINALFNPCLIKTLFYNDSSILFSLMYKGSSWGGWMIFHFSIVKKGKVFYGQEHPNGESITTVCGVNY